MFSPLVEECRRVLDDAVVHADPKAKADAIEKVRAKGRRRLPGVSMSPNAATRSGRKPSDEKDDTQKALDVLKGFRKESFELLAYKYRVLSE